MPPDAPAPWHQRPQPHATRRPSPSPMAPDTRPSCHHTPRRTPHPMPPRPYAQVSDMLMNSSDSTERGLLIKRLSAEVAPWAQALLTQVRSAERAPLCSPQLNVARVCRHADAYRPPPPGTSQTPAPRAPPYSWRMRSTSFGPWLTSASTQSCRRCVLTTALRGRR